MLQVPEMLTVWSPGKLWMSNITLQGDGPQGNKDSTMAIFLYDPETSLLFGEGTITHLLCSAMPMLGCADMLWMTDRHACVLANTPRICGTLLDPAAM